MKNDSPAPSASSEDVPLDAKKTAELRDLGFGTLLASRSGARLLNRDGSFNVRREGVHWSDSLYLFDLLLTLSWGRFLGLVALAYLSINLFFAAVYCGLGEAALVGPEISGLAERYLQALFFSFHTLSTAGYGNIVPNTLAANLIVATESIVGLFTVAVVTGMVFARFSRPSVNLMFSDWAVIAPYQDGQAFMFRVANQRHTQLIEVEAKVVLSIMVKESGRDLRRFFPLKLERSKVMFFPLAWTLVHPIDDDSPFTTLSASECAASDAEVMVLVTAIDETFSQTVHTRTSYKAEEIVWNAKFADMYKRPIEPGSMGIDLRKLHQFDKL